MLARTAWVKRPFTTKGLDPLAVQAPCINIYGHLLPGITNVTDRARYYSFYPWMIWTLNQLAGEKSHADLIQWVRRADCLFTMIGIRHRIKSQDNDMLRHDAALIGSQTLRPLLADLDNGGRLDLSKYTTLDDGNSNRYFQNRLGGLGQYYLGTLDGLGLMGRRERGVGYTAVRGKELAEAFDLGVNRSAFVSSLQAGSITNKNLDELAGFCPCQITSSTLEHEMLLDLFFDRKGEFGDAGVQRRHSLGLLLHLVNSLTDIGIDSGVLFDQYVYRACTYTGSLPNSQAWDLPPNLTSARRGWAVYQRNEMMSLAVQCVFWVALTSLQEQDHEVHTVENFVQWFKNSDWVCEAISGFQGKRFEEAVDEKRREIPEIAAWERDEHEISMAHQLLELYRGRNAQDVRSEMLRLSLHVILSLVVRDDVGREAYDPLSFPADYLSLYSINLSSLRAMSSTAWRRMDMASWTSWLAGYWGVEAHLRVALRKLRQGKDTFHILPTDHGLRVANLPDPGYTSPRLNTSIQILQDLGAMMRPQGSASVRLTALGDDLRRFAIE